MNIGGYSIYKMYEESKEVLLNPQDYFLSMETQGGLREPVIKALVYGVVAGIFAFFWNLLNITGISMGSSGGSGAIVGLFGAIISAVIGVFIGGLIILIISNICKGNTDFEPSVRVAAATMVLYPINVFLGFFGAISYSLGEIISLAVSLYGVYLIYLAVTTILQGEIQTARTVSYVLAGISILLFII